MNKTSFGEYLQQYGVLTYRIKGVSMKPMLRQGRDSFTVVRKTDKRCSKYDVVLYHRAPDEYVLHRIIKVRDNDYVILGDNCINKEYGIKDEDILGVMTSFVRKGKEHQVSEPAYRLYVRLWCMSAPVRILLKKLKGRIRKNDNKKQYGQMDL